jgi:alpha-tubulin suppressor-like RCC1 family protein
VPATPVTAYQDSGVITTNGAYYTWGRNNLGQLGIGSQTAYSDVPRQVTFADAKGQRDTSAVVAVYLGGSEPYNGQTAVELSGGSWWAFGDNSYGQLADGTSKNAFSPQSLTTPAGTVAVASGGGALYALTDEGDVWSVGQGYLGELGDGSYRNSPTWVLADSGVRSVSTTASNVSVLRGRQVSPLRPGLGG